MAAYSSRAQHFVECDQCEENPAKFVCKTCPGNLCDKCKTEHENRKITKNHEITEFKTANKELIDFLYCSDHKTKKIECFCGPCKKPVCTDCIVLSHNGHAVKAISSAYKEIKEDMQIKKDEIDKKLLPKYRQLLENEAKKSSDLKKEADKIENKILAYTQHIMETVKSLGEKAVQDLRIQEGRGLQKIDESRAELQSKIGRLKQTRIQLSEQIEGKPGISFFKPVDGKLLQEFETCSNIYIYKLRDFQPGPLSSMVKLNFGTLPDLGIHSEIQAKKHRGRIKPVHRPQPPCPCYNLCTCGID
uniref:Tripartite motif-containing protein 45-like n=1 Tax=Crassostrea virginica TaxID=6565 RepID=A0A8B8C752_CRAVI|nr:tripartite motif-containing protein 45-like [Crassostrea virginica]